jgi:AcrR family transcriptional regulator
MFVQFVQVRAWEWFKVAGNDKREAVLNAGRVLLLKQGYRATSMEAIAAEAGISKATLYKYYGDKEAVLVALATELLVAVHRAFLDGLRAKGTLTLRVAEALVAKYRTLGDFMAGSPFASELFDAHHKLVGTQVRAAEEEAGAALVEALRKGDVAEPERIAAILDGAAYGLYRKGKVDLLDGIVTVVEGVLRGK